MRKPRRLKPRKLERLHRLEPGHPRWPIGLRPPQGVTHCWTDWNTIVLVSEFDTEEFGTVTHLWIRDKASSVRWPWYLLQQIKNAICGEHRIAIEVFPRTAELVDQANMRHIWVLGEDYSLPFGIHKGVPS